MDIGFVPVNRGVGHVLDSIPVQSFDSFINRKKHLLLIAANVIIVVAVKPAELEADAISGASNSAEVQQVSFSDNAFGILTELPLYRRLMKIETLGATVLLVVGLDRDKGIALGQGNENRVVEDIHGTVLLSKMCSE